MAWISRCPRIAVTTGTCDNLVCLIAKLGIDPDEWGIEGEDKAVTFYRGKFQDWDPYTISRFSGSLAEMKDASELWGDYETLSSYDVSLFSCECEEALENKGDAAYDAVTRYLAEGGRVFMPIDNYGFSRRFGWCADRFGVSWQLNLS